MDKNNITKAMTEEEVKKIAIVMEPIMNALRELVENHEISNKIFNIYLWPDGSIEAGGDALGGWEISQDREGGLKLKFRYEAKIVKGADKNE